MLDNICSLPLKSDIFAQAIHPTTPLLCVGLSSGHVETYRLPSIDEIPEKKSSTLSNAKLNGRGRRLSEDGFDTVDSVWRTCRHKGSCRSLSYSLDGNTLFSTGRDGLVKAAETETGKVTAKIVVPLHRSSAEESHSPSVLCTLSPQALLLATDTSYVHVLDLRTPLNSPSSKASQSFRPHDRVDEQPSSESISSLTPLPPTSASTSGTCRSWVSTAGSTLAVTDLRKGVVSLSEDQRDLLMSSTCLPGSASANTSSEKSPKISNTNATDRVVVGAMSGGLTVWDRGNWTDRAISIPLKSNSPVISDAEEVEQVTAVPSHVRLGNQTAGPDTVAAGIGDGTIAIVRILPKRGKILGRINHDDRSIDGITTLGFDVAGRMISGGGQLVKIWHEKSHEEEAVSDEEDAPAAATISGLVPGEEEQDSQDDIDSDRDSDSEEEDKARQTKHRRKKRKRNLASPTHGNHGVMAFQGMD